MRHRNLSGLAAPLLAGLLAAQVTGGAPASALDTAGRMSDVNGDAFADLVIGVPGYDVGGHEHAGAVHVISGRSSGLSLGTNRIITQNTTGLSGTSEAWDEFGEAVVTGDFNGDLFSDVAIGIPGQRVGGSVSAGAVQIVYGGALGLTTTDAVLTQTSTGLDTSETGDWYGGSLVVGNFDTDGFDDLAIGAPGEGVGGAIGAGAVDVIYGSSSGLTGLGGQHFTLATSGVPGNPGSNDRFGSALAAASFDGGAGQDLAIGVPGQDLPGASDAGEVIVLRSIGWELTGSGAQRWNQDSTGIEGTAETGDEFGAALAAYAFGTDGFGDLAIGVPGEDVAGITDAGSVNLIQGSATGLGAHWNREFDEDVSGMPGRAARYERFGSVLAVGDVGGDILTDLIVGVPDERLSGIDSAGAVYVIPSWVSAPEAYNVKLFYRGRGVPGTAEWGDRFGASVAAGNVNADYYGDELVIGVPGDQVGGLTGAGSVEVVWSGAFGTGNHGRLFLSEATPGLESSPGRFDGFGGDTAA